MRLERSLWALALLLFACEPTPSPGEPDAGPVDGAIDDGAVDDGAVDDGAVDDGAVDDDGGTVGAVDDGAVDDGAVDDDGGTVDAGPLVDGGPPPACGDGTLDPGEACDDGEANSDSSPDACRTSCVLPACGDGVTDEGEQCDEGADNGSASGGCRADCRLPWCGDGVIDPGEQCDEGAGNGETSGACRPWCTAPRCGDGVVDPGELCDDGFGNSDRVPGACRTTCTLATCGDGTLDTGEQCDEGAGASDSRPDACRTTCVRASCGDGVVDTGEECDDGAANSDTVSSACRTSCRLPYCGDGVREKETERCDDGADNSLEPGACRPDCTPPRCGDGIVDPREECDDGNASDADGCDSTCRALVCPPARPITCHPSTTTVPGTSGQTICQVLMASTSLAAYRAHPGIQAMSTTLTSASADACIEHYFPTCSVRCPCLRLARSYSLELCEALDTALMPTVCRAELARGCVDVVESTCPTATRALCADERFRTQSGRDGIPACASYVDARCDAIAAAECPALDLTVCGAWARDRSSYPADCGWWAAERCPTILSTCPTRSLERCSTLDTLAPTLDPICAESLTRACAGWEDRYCPTNIIGRPPVSADNCLRELDVLRADRFPECRPWVEDTCERLVAEQMQSRLETTTQCRTHIAREGEGYDYSVEEGVTEASRFDCTQAEILMVRPDLLSFTPTAVESLAGELELAAERRRLGASSVRSCDEYVDQRYWSHRAFQLYTRSFSHDARRVMQAAYAVGPDYEDFALGSRGLLPSELGFGNYPNHMPRLSDPGVSYALHPRGGERRPKNDFVELLLPENAEALDAFLYPGNRRAPDPFDRERRRTRNASIRDDMSRVLAYWDLGNGFSARDGWHWHPQMSSALGRQGVTDEELAHLHRRRERFRELLALRRRRAEAYATARTPEQEQDAGLMLWAVDDEIEALLVDADERGCFEDRRDASGQPIPSPCDWAPRDFQEDVDELFGRRRDESLELCRRYAPADFSTLASGYTYLVLGVPEPVWRSEGADPTRTSADFDVYLSRRRQTLRLLGEALGAVDESRRPLWGQSWSEGDEIGDPEWFAAGWSADLSWAIDLPPDAVGYCGIDARAHGAMTAYVTLDHQRRNLIDAGLDAGARAQRFATHLEVLGVDVWNESLGSSTGSASSGFDALTYDFNVVFAQTRESVERRTSVEIPVFSIAGFDIVLELGAAGRLGLDVSGSFRLWVNDDDGCGPGLDLALTGAARPFMELDGFAQVGIDLFVVEIGIGGEMRLLDVAAPLSVGILGRTTGPLQAIGRAQIGVNVDARVELGTLSGRLYVYAETWWDTYRKTIFSWDGYQWTLPVFTKSYTYELQPLIDFCSPRERCL